ncbi:hypothetical protein BEL04_08500 [Mucilaginibacter sp. PPCGB 2223]|nr:hypothetical protein BEL04_08500 [Mucilaginibacter sp. PPCGB 2223]
MLRRRAETARSVTNSYRRNDRRKKFTTGKIGLFTDAVFAIVIALLALELKVELGQKQLTYPDMV